MEKDCLFCKIAAGEIPADKVFEDEQIIAFKDIRPKAPVHLLIIPREHIENVDTTTDEHKELLARLILTARDLAREQGIAETGYRLVLNTNPDSGQEVYHIHLHLLGGRRFTWPPG